jgi:hypothetical protein
MAQTLYSSSSSKKIEVFNAKQPTGSTMLY